MRYVYDKSSTQVVLCKSNLQLACDCRVRHEECCGLLKHVSKTYDNRSDRQFDIMEIVYDFSMTRAARAIKIVCDNRKQKSYCVNRPLDKSIQLDILDNPTLFNESKVFLRGRLSLMGTSDINSTPPAITASQLPLAIRPTAVHRKNKFTTVKPLLSGHLWDLPKCPLNRGCCLMKVRKNCETFVNN